MRLPSAALRVCMLHALATAIVCKTSARDSEIPAVLLQELSIAEFASKLTANGIVTAQDLRDLNSDDMKALGIKIGGRNRVIKWQRRPQRTLSTADVALINGMVVVDYNNLSARKLIKQRQSMQPLLIHNGFDPRMKKLMKQFSDQSKLAKILPRIVPKHRFWQGYLQGVKWSPNPKFAEWDDKAKVRHNIL